MSEMNAAESEQIEVATTGEARWSDRADQRLTEGRVIGVLAVLIGAILFAVGEARSTLTHNLLSSSGLTLLTVGVIVFVAASRTRHIAPDRSFAPLPVTNPRMWFVLLWGAGIAVLVILSLLDTADIVAQLIILALSLILMTAGSVWVLHWLGGQRVKLWPANAELLLRWVPSWTVLWAGVWGVVSTLLAMVIEAAPVLVLALLSGTALKEVPQTQQNLLETLERASRDPLLLILVFAGAVIGAPLVEEAVKAVGLRGLRRWIQRPADGWLLGFAAGLGFGLLEGAFYLDTATTENWFLGGWLRLAALLLHGLATSLVGLAYARYLQTRQRSELWRGYLRAVVMHGLWNASALTVAFLGLAADRFRTADLVVLFACLVLVSLVGAAVLMVLLLRRVATAGVQSSIQEDYQQAGVLLPGGWSPMKYNLGWRLVGRQPIFVPVTVQPDDSLGGSSANPIDDGGEKDRKSE